MAWPKPEAPDLGLDFHGLTERRSRHRIQHRRRSPAQPRMKLRDLLALLKATYTGSIGAEFMHITDAEQRRWMYERLEKPPAAASASQRDDKRASSNG
jgi:2-oxoglutarate dehydrogenase E1 component